MGQARIRGDRATRIAQAVDRKNQKPKIIGKAEAQVGIAEDKYVAISDLGFPIDPGVAVVPIVLKSEDQQHLSIVGTGFFVGPDLIITAKHVVDSGKPENILCLHVLPESNEYYFRPLIEIERHPTSDIALCCLKPIRPTARGPFLSNHVLAIGGLDPQVGTKVITYAYPDSEFTLANGLPELSFAAHYYDGKILDSFPKGRDKVILPFPCFRTSINLHGGSSGGPVINPETGIVFAINSTSFAGATDESSVAKIHPILDIPIRGVHFENGIPVAKNLRQLSVSNQARVVPEHVLMQSRTVKIKVKT